MFTPRLPVRTSPPWEGLGEAPWGCSTPSSFYCSRRDAADGMPVMALVLIFVSPHSQLGVRVFIVTGRHKPEGFVGALPLRMIKDALSSV